MSKKLAALIGGLTTAAAGAAIAIVTYCAPEKHGGNQCFNLCCRRRSYYNSRSVLWKYYCCKEISGWCRSLGGLWWKGTCGLRLYFCRRGFYDFNSIY